MYLSHQHPHESLAADLLRFAYAVGNCALHEAKTFPRSLCPLRILAVRHWTNWSNLRHALTAVGGDQGDREDYAAQCLWSSKLTCSTHRTLSNPLLVNKVYHIGERWRQRMVPLLPRSAYCNLMVATKLWYVLWSSFPCKRSIVDFSTRSPQWPTQTVWTLFGDSIELLLFWSAMHFNKVHCVQFLGTLLIFIIWSFGNI